MKQGEGKRRTARQGMLVVGALRFMTYAVPFVLFFGLMSIRNWQLRNVSRTLAITLLTWGCMTLAMHGVYGGFDVGRKKNKPIVTGLILSAMFTDLVTYLSLQIMNVNEHNNQYLLLLGPDAPMLALIFVLQSLFIILMVRMGNHAFFHYNAPQRCLLIAGNEAEVATAAEKIKRYQLQWKLDDIALCNAPDLDARIDRAEVVFLSGVPDDVRMPLLRQCYACQRDVYCKAQVQDVMLSTGRQVVVDDALFLEMDHHRMTASQRFLKRALDIVVSLCVLVIGSPVLAVIAAAIRAEDGGKVLFCQKRATLKGRTFVIYKFRTMRIEDTVEGAASSATEDDRRITRVGVFLRRWRLDELPQFVNVLRGDMSLVGPRPEMLENISRYKLELPSFAYREQMKAGLTGYAQIEGRYNTSPEDKLMLDLMYIESFSLREDLKLLLRTVTVFFKKDSTQGFRKEERKHDQAVG